MINNQSGINKTSLITTGINGLVGSKFADLYKNKYNFDSLDVRDPDNPVDIRNYDQIISRLEKSDASTVIHLAAFTDVTTAWKQEGDKEGIAYQVNVVGTKNIVKACLQTKKKLIHISTSFVFDGENEGLYKETDPVKPIEWYGQTKTEAEEIVKESSIDWTILRIDKPFRSDPFMKIDIAHDIINKIKNNNLPPQFDNHFFGPTFIDDFAKVINFFVVNKHNGVFHATSGEKWSDYDFACLINEKLNLKGKIEAGDLNEYLAKKNRPYQKNTALDCTKLKKVIDFKLNSIPAAILQIQNS